MILRPRASSSDRLRRPTRSNGLLATASRATLGREAASKKAVIAAGAKIVTDVNKAEFQAVMKPVWDKFSPTPALKSLVQEIVNAK